MDKHDGVIAEITARRSASPMPHLLMIPGCLPTSNQPSTRLFSVRNDSSETACVIVSHVYETAYRRAHMNRMCTSRLPSRLEWGRCCREFVFIANKS